MYPLDARPRPEGMRLLVGLQAWARLGSALMASYGDILAHFPLAEQRSRPVPCRRGAWDRANDPR